MRFSKLPFRSVKVWGAAACVLASLTFLWAQQQAQPHPAQPVQPTGQTPTISVNVRVVNVLATVRDKHGNLVNSLSQNDFTLEEDGRPQTIKYFTRESDLPLTLGLLVDTSYSQREALDQEKSASSAFAGQVLRDNKDAAFLIHFDHEVELLQDLTKSREKMVGAFQQLQIGDRPSFSQTGGGQQGGGGGRGGRHGGGSGGGAGTLLYDSVYLASNELMAKEHGRKAVIVLTDGVDHGSKMTLTSAIESAQRADTMVYSIYFKGNEGGGGNTHFGGPWNGGGGGGGRRGGGWPGGGGGYPGGGGNGGGRRGGGSGESSEDGKKVLKQLSEETGGRMFEVSKKEPIDQIYSQIQAELRNQYNLGYTPDRAADDGPEYRHIKVAIKQKDMAVQAREGYYASQQVAAKQPGE